MSDDVSLLDRLVVDESGNTNDPFSSGDWSDWISATALSGFVLENPLIDWLRYHGEAAGFSPKRSSFDHFIASKGEAFEAAVVQALAKKADVELSIVGGGVGSFARSLKDARETVQMLLDGAPLIWQGVLRNPDELCYGQPDLLIRSDVLASLFPDAISDAEVADAATGLDMSRFHYRVIDVKLKKLQLLVAGGLSSGGSWTAYQAQLHVYNAALARLQGHDPGIAYLLGRGWEIKNKGKSDDPLDRLAVVSTTEMTDTVTDAVSWVRRVRSEGHNWHPYSSDMAELLPRLDKPNYAWSDAVSEIAEHQKDVTLLWRVSAKHRAAASAAGIARWDDQRLTSEVLELTSKTGRVVDRILEANRSPHPVLLPERIEAARDRWQPEPPLEFYVDFETTELPADFSKIETGTSGDLGSIIFMIGCGHVENGQWVFTCFTVDRLNAAEENRIIRNWDAHMKQVTDRLSPGFRPAVVHYHLAEPQGVSKAVQRAEAEGLQSLSAAQEINWLDLCKEVIQREPVTVTGSFGFGLKSVAKAMYQAGMIETVWDESSEVADGMAAMVSIAEAYAQIEDDPSAKLSHHSDLKVVERYNEVDCKTMLDILSYLRLYH